MSVRGALPSLRATLCLFVCFQLFLLSQGPFRGCKQAGAFHRHKHVEVPLFIIMFWPVLSIYRYGHPAQPAVSSLIEAFCQ